MKNGHLTFKIFFLLVLNDIGDSIAQIFMKKGLTVTGIDTVGFSNLLEFISRNSTSLLIWVGLLFYVLNFFIWIVILSRIELSIAMPIGSTCYIITPLAAMMFLHERVSPVRWAGILLIVAGIYFVSKSKRAKAGES